MNLTLITNREDLIRLVPEYELRGEQYPFLFLCDEKIVAEGELKFDSGEPGALEVKYVNVYDKKKGYGKMFVEFLKSLPNVKEIWGEAIAEAVPFWKKVGAEFDQEEYESYLQTEEFEEGFLMIFTISVAKKKQF